MPCSILFAAALFAPGPPTDLRVNLLRHPEKAIITRSDLQFSWIVNDTRQLAGQGAFEIEIDKKERGVVWKSKVVRSSQSVNVPYSGFPLPSGFYKWKVRSADEHGKLSPWSEWQNFEIRLAAKDDVKKWEGESRWQTTGADHVLEDRQSARFEPVKAFAQRMLSNGNWIIDFGRAAFGTLQFETNGSNPSPLKVRLGERANSDGSVDSKVGRSSIGYVELEVKPDANGHFKTILPRHIGKYPHSQALPSFMDEVTPFRYAEIIGLPKNVEPTNVFQNALFHDYNDTESEFICSDLNLQKIWSLCKYTLKATPFLSLYCDGNRERMPYEADAYIQQLGHFSVDAEYSAANYSLIFLLNHASWPTEWQSQAIFMAWHYWMSTGDVSTASKYYSILSEKTLMGLAGPDGLISTRAGKANKEFLKKINLEQRDLNDIVDWPAGERDGFVMSDVNCVVNAFHIASLRKLSDIAGALGKFQESGLLRRRASDLTRRFHDAFYDPEKKLYRDGVGINHYSLHANMFALNVGLVPETCKRPVIEFIKSKGMACSVYGSQYLLEALFDNDEPSTALSLMTDTGDRGWLHMLDLGSTMTMEAWDEKYKPNLTWNHAWGSAPANIIPRKLFGIEPMEPGFASVQIRPRFGNLKQASLKYPTIRGPIKVTWDSEAKKPLVIELPANMKGTLLWDSGKNGVIDLPLIAGQNVPNLNGN